MRAAENFGNAAAGKTFRERSIWELIFDPKEELRKRRTSNAELGKEFRQDVGNEVNGEVADHVRDQVAPPKVKASEDRTPRARADVGRADSCCEMKADWIT